MQAEVIKTFHFSAAHSLDKAPDGHKCRGLHGHNYRVDIHVAGSFDNEQGWVMDFGRIKHVVGPVLDALDHHCLNDIADLANSTSEHLARYIWEKVSADLPGLSAITVWESQSSRCVYRGQ